MRKILATFFTLLVISHQNSYAEPKPPNSSIFNVNNESAKNFPFGTEGEFSIIVKNSGKVKICLTGEGTCEEFKIPSQVQLATSHIPGPFIGAAQPSWIAQSRNAIYVCAVKKNDVQAECVKLGKIKPKDIEIAVRYRGVIPELTLSSSSNSQEYVERYAKVFAASFKSALILLKNDTTSDGGFTTMSEDMPIVEIHDQLPPPDIGSGGIAVVPIGGGNAGTDPSTWGDGGGGEGASGCQVSSGGSSNGGTCPTVADLLKRCIDSADYNYYQRYIPACQRIYNGNSEMLRWCYEEAAQQYADDLTFCRETYK